MADSSIQLPTDGSGKSIDTRTVSSEHRQVVVIGDPAQTNTAVVGGSGALGIENITRAISAGGVSGYSMVQKFGRNSQIDTTTDPEDVWGGGGEYTGHPTGSAETIDVFSSDAADTSAGTGARTVRIEGLDASGEEQSEDVTLNGTSAVTTSNTWTRCFRQYVLTAGSGGANAGNITFRHTTTTSNVFSVMAAGFNQSLIAAYTIPSNKIGFLIGYTVQMGRASGAAGSANVSLRTRTTGGVYRARYVHEVTDAFGIDRVLPGVLSLPASTDIKWRVDSVSDNATIVTATFDIILVTV